jgi:hypothetical protein
MSQVVETIKELMGDVLLFSKTASQLKLRSYQEAVAAAIIDSVLQRKGLTFVVMFPRQSGKNELQAQIETFLLTIFGLSNAEMVKISPTWKPQSLNAMRRLERVLGKNVLTRQLWQKESGYIYRMLSARIFFFTGSPEANIVGATAGALLEVDEAQDVQIAKFDKDIAPMAASTNATRVFWGTAWTSRTLLARELRAARLLEREDGVRRVFVLTAEDVAREVPAYRSFVDEQVRRLGRNHPLVKTQYFSEEIDAEGGMFTEQRRALMQGIHTSQQAPHVGGVYAALLDVAGEDEGVSNDMGALQNPRRDLTALTMVECDLSTLADELVQAPTYRAVCRYQWQGRKHSLLYAELKAIIEHWKVRFVVVDATGVGTGLASFLDKAFPGRVIPFQFRAASKSRLGWDFLAVIDTGRWKEYTPHDDLQVAFWTQCEYCEYLVMDGPGKIMRWGVPDGTRSTETGELLHDDLLISAALCSVLDEQKWGVYGKAAIIQAQDPLQELDEGF